MPIEPKPPADIAIDEPLVRTLLAEQHPDLADLQHVALTRIGEGWDNSLFRLGDDFIVRLPRRAASATLIEHEQQWLPPLSKRLPLPVPVPCRAGRPSSRFPWSWSVVPWLPGQAALFAPPRNLEAMAVALGQFVRALHEPAPPGVPDNPWRGVPVAARTEALRQHLRQLGALVDASAALGLWDRVLSARAWAGPRLWIHGDLHPGNLLVSQGRLSAVIDFGDLTAGDPATDLSAAWIALPRSARAAFRASARGPFNRIDDDTWVRARGWALALGLAYMARSKDDAAMGVLGRTTVEAALSDEG
jgi:aminoglycoside phosphotransferase (APT) family kinase protein